jgi:hypothetical protein
MHACGGDDDDAQVDVASTMMPAMMLAMTRHAQDSTAVHP